MEVINFLDHSNGKLFSRMFGDVRLHAYDSKYEVGNELTVQVRGVEWGVVTVTAEYQFLFKNIRSVLSNLCYGKSPHFMAAKLRTFYDGILKNGLKEDTILKHIVFEWKHRIMDVQNAAIKDYWDGELQAHRPVELQGRLFD
jgi:hypothetical protein